MRTRRGLVTGVACLSLVACEKNGLPEVEAVQQNVVVQAFDDCTGLEQYIEDRAVLAMRATLLGRLEDESAGMMVPFPVADEAPRAAMSENDAAGPSAYTTTNLQVSGVDEADFMKNTGTRILVLSGQKLHVTRSWPADQLQLISSLGLEGMPREMFLNEQKQVVIFSQVFQAYPWLGTCGDKACSGTDANTLKITVVDLTNEAAPQVVRSEYLPGTYLSSRRIGSSVRVVTSDPFRWPAGVELYLTRDVGDGDRAVRAAAYDELIERNERLIRAEPLEHWLPKGKRVLPDGSEAEVGYSCREFARPTGATQLGLVTVATLDLAATAPLGRTSIVAAANEVYSNGTSLYVATAHWWWWPRAGQSDWTYLHKFDVSQPGNATYLASGAVEGQIVDQFSMDEYQGNLRVATNLVKRVDSPGSWRGTLKWTSRVQVLAQASGAGTSALTLVGTTGDLADEERLYSSRFIGNRGYLVTFHEVIRMDPLFTLDLSDPTQPRVVGQLEMPGYSNYLHPVDDTHLLAVGVGDNNGVKVSLYDLTDFANPRTQSDVVVGSFETTSEAQQDHKAFNYFPEKKLLAIPFFSQTWATGFVSQLKVFRVDVATGISTVGTLDVSDMYDPFLGYSWDWRVSPGVRRSVMADDFVYAVSDAGIRSANVGALSAPVATVRFSPPTR